MIGAQVSLQQANTIRLIPSGRLKPATLAPLVDTPEELEDLARLESATQGRLSAQQSGLGALHPRELVFGVPNYTFVNAAFAYPRSTGNRFNGGERGAWYCGFEIATSLAEVSFHLTRALEDAGRQFENETTYAELFADFIGPFHDLRGALPTPDCLNPDIAIGYSAGQALAEALLESEPAPSGIVYPSVRNSGGTCLVALFPAVVQNVRQGGLWRMQWSGSSTPTIEQAERSL